MGRGLRIATFNLESLDDRPRAGCDFEDRVKVLRPQLQRLRADVLCLQEVNGQETSRHGPRVLSALDRLVEDTEYQTFHRVVSVNRGGLRYSDRHNLVILARPPVLSHCQVWHDLVAPPLHAPIAGPPAIDAPAAGQPVEWDRPLLHAVLELAGKRRLHVLNLHLRAPRAAFVAGQKDGPDKWHSVAGWAEGFTLAAVKRAGQALEARLVLERIFDAEPDPLIVVCGDFNAEERETPVRTIRGDEEDTGNGHLAPRALVALDRSIAGADRYSVIHHGRPLMLDHLLVSRPLLGWYRGCEVHNEGLGDELVSPALVAGSPQTYHAPVVAEFSPPPHAPARDAGRRGRHDSQ